MFNQSDMLRPPDWSMRSFEDQKKVAIVIVKSESRQSCDKYELLLLQHCCTLFSTTYDFWPCMFVVKSEVEYIVHTSVQWHVQHKNVVKNGRYVP